MGCSSSSTQTSAQDGIRPGAKPEESNGDTIFVARNGIIAEDTETIADQMQLPVQSAIPDDFLPGPSEELKTLTTEAKENEGFGEEVEKKSESEPVETQVTPETPVVLEAVNSSEAEASAEAELILIPVESVTPVSSAIAVAQVKTVALKEAVAPLEAMVIIEPVTALEAVTTVTTVTLLETLSAVEVVTPKEVLAIAEVKPPVKMVVPAETLGQEELAIPVETLAPEQEIVVPAEVLASAEAEASVATMGLVENVDQARALVSVETVVKVASAETTGVPVFNIIEGPATVQLLDMEETHGTAALELLAPAQDAQQEETPSVLDVSHTSEYPTIEPMKELEPSPDVTLSPEAPSAPDSVPEPTQEHTMEIEASSIAKAQPANISQLAQSSAPETTAEGDMIQDSGIEEAKMED